MTVNLPIPLLAVVLPLAVMLGLRGSLFALLVSALCAGVVPGLWIVSGVKFDLTDVMLGGLFLGVLVRARPRIAALVRQIPHFGLWFTLMLLSALAYLSAPINQEYLTDPIRIAYQLYRYAWRELLFYPLTMILVTDRRRMHILLAGLVLACDLSVVLSIGMGYAGTRTGGLFDWNTVGSAYLLPILACVAGLTLIRKPHLRALIALNLLLFARALLFSGSRGSFISILLSLTLLTVLLAFYSPSRRRVLRLAALAAAVLGIMILARPGLSERPTIQRLTSIGRPQTASTLQWRIEERWPHFWRLALENPWLGRGTSVDERLGDSVGMTPHNGYLAIAVERGFPALLLTLTLGLLAILRATRILLQSSTADSAILGALFAAALAGLFIHNLVDSTLVNPFVARSFWLTVALAFALGVEASSSRDGVSA